MQKKLLTVAVTSTLLAMGAAQAQVEQVAGTGDTLLGAMYSTEAGQDTYINIVNTTANAKGVKVRFREGRGSEDSLDFHLYLSPFDMWAAAITRDGDDVVVVTADTSCTVPFVDSDPATTGARMRTTYIPSVYSPADAGGITAEQRVREGYVELIEMADFGSDTSRPDGPWTTDAEAAQALATWNPNSAGPVGQLIAWASKHGSDGVPRNCAAINAFNGGNHSPATASTGQFLVGPLLPQPRQNAGFNRPSGGLFGNMGLISVQQGSYVPFEMDAFRTHPRPPLPGGPIFFSQNANEGPGFFVNWTLDRGLVYDKTVVGQGGDLQHFDLPDLSTGYNGTQEAAETRLFGINDKINATTVVSEYVVDPSIGASTDWVITFPTKKFHVSGPYDTSTGAPTGPVAIPPFSKRFNQKTATSCEPIRLSYFDREEQSPITPPGGPDFSPGRPDVPVGNFLCFEMNVVSFNDGDLASPSRVLGGLSTRQNLALADGFQSGWGSIAFVGDNTDGYGLPVIGFSAYNLVNDNVQGGVLANYGGAFANRYVEGSGSNFDLLQP